MCLIYIDLSVPPIGATLSLGRLEYQPRAEAVYVIGVTAILMAVPY